MFNTPTFIGNASILTITLTSCLAMAQTLPPSRVDSDSATEAWHSESVVYVAGLPDLKQNTPGALKIEADNIVFSNKVSNTQIPLGQITGVYVGDERVATGGTGAKVARRIPFFGFGAAVGAVTNKKVDLLTFEYRDNDGGYHGAVFELPKTQAVLAQQQLSSLTTASPTPTVTSCSHVADPNTILVAPIVSTNVEIPAEYRILLYEQLIEQLRMAHGTGTIYRIGSASAPCAAKSLLLSVTAFKKGNEAVRSSTGPVGYFVGGTSVTFHISLTNPSGTVFFEKALKESKHGDGDSLSVTRDLAKSVSKRLQKAKQLGAPGAL